MRLRRTIACASCVSPVKLDPAIITEYSQRDTTRREHLTEIQNNFGFHTFNTSTYKQFSKWLLPFAISSDKGMALVGALIDEMRLHQIIIPAISTVERLAWADSVWQSMRSCQTIPVAVTTDFTTYIQQRSLELSSQLSLVYV